ncbi:hypothetical protein [Numidum massiliense]|uniref:hypothetical protein n=1 Tax=Numidum massiliense TaxID=1522315 RepID=UPI0006D5951E|nr:hypothetical protein [Numidum massiliense]
MIDRVLQWAFAQQVPVQIVYVDASGKWSQRIIRIRTIADDCVYAYCFSRKGVRTFRIARIYAAQIDAYSVRSQATLLQPCRTHPQQRTPL